MKITAQGYYNRGERSPLNAAKTSGALQPRGTGRVSVAEKLPGGNIKGRGFLLNWPNRILTGQELGHQRQGMRNLIRYPGWSDSQELGILT